MHIAEFLKPASSSAMSWADELDVTESGAGASDRTHLHVPLQLHKSNPPLAKMPRLLPLVAITAAAATRFNACAMHKRMTHQHLCSCNPQ